MLLFLRLDSNWLPYSIFVVYIEIICVHLWDFMMIDECGVVKSDEFIDFCWRLERRVAVRGEIAVEIFEVIILV
jgi:hypothetical protein